MDRDNGIQDPPGSLTKKTTTALIWSFADLMANHGIQFIIQIILARLLLPEHFGLIGMIVVFIALSNAVVDSGFSQALIRDQHTTQVDYSTVFYFNLGMSFVSYAGLYVCSSYISNYFNQPQLIDILRVMSIVVIINAVAIIQRVMLMKKVDFRTITKISVIASTTSGILTIIVAVLGFGVWSLVINMLSLQLIQSLLLFIYNKWMPSFTFSYRSFRRFFGFSFKLLISGLIDTIYNNIFSLIIGKYYSTRQLGYYTNALKFRDIASHSIASTVQRVTYPILSSVQDDDIRLKMGFRKIIQSVAYINFPALLGLAAVAEPVFYILFGEKWMPSVIYFQLLCVAGALYPLHALNLNILQVKGRADLFLMIEIYKKIVLTVLLVLFISLKTGILGLIFAAVINSYISLLINIYFSGKQINYSLMEQLRDLTPSFLISIVMGVSVICFKLIASFNPIIDLILQILIGIFVYIGISRWLNLRELNYLIELLIPILEKLKGKGNRVWRKR